MDQDEEVRQQVLRSTLQEIEATTDKDSSDVCVICLESISEKAVALPCRHDSFDFICLLNWLEQQSVCPLCKTSIKTVEYGNQGIDRQVYQVPAPKVISKAPSSDSANRAVSGFSNSRQERRPHFSTPRATGVRENPTPSAALLRRKRVYQERTYSLHVGTNRLSRFQDLTPAQFANDVELISRARKWIRRELQVFDFLSVDARNEGESGARRRVGNAEFLLEYIIAILKTVDMKGSSGQAEDMLQEFLGRENTQIFLHELRAWLRSPYTSLDDWDRHVQYGTSLFVHADTREHGNTGNSSRGGSELAKFGKRKGGAALYDSYRPRKRVGQFH
ncbi:hypothetical protein MMC25_003688 [Agyrium rufum]|nr:hypothetical protein [Agyrium rufum]